jgi:hypothetical protein
LAHFDLSCNAVAYLPGVFPEHGLSEIKSVILAYPILLAEGEGLHIDWDSVPWKDGYETVWIQIAKVVVHAISMQNVTRVLSDTAIRYEELVIRPIPVAELHSPFFQNNIRGHIHEAATREVITGGTVPVWADPHEVHISERIAGQPLQPWQLSFTVAEYILSKSDDPGEELFDRSIFTQIVMGPKKGQISFIVAPGMMQLAWDQCYWLDMLIMGSYPTITSPIQWTSNSPSISAPEVSDASPTPIPAHGFVESHDGQDHDSVEVEDEYSAATSLKAPPESDAHAEDDGERRTSEEESPPGPDSPSHGLVPVELVNALRDEINDLKLQGRQRDELLTQLLKELMSRQEATTQCLTSLGHEITVLSNGSSPDNVSGLTGSSQTSLTRAIILAINEAIQAAYSPGGIVANRCEEDANMTNEQFALMIRENVLDGIFPEIQETIVTAIRDQTEAMTRLVTSLARVQAGEIANVVKKHLSPAMNAMSEGLLRLATTVELALNAPSHSTMGSIAHDVSPTYELLKDTRNAIRILGARITSGLEFMHKIGFEIVESLSREQRIEASHEKAVRKYLKNIKVVTNLVQAAVDTENPGESQSFTKAIITTNFNSFATNGKNSSIRKEQKGFLAHPKRAKRFFRTQKNFFLNKNTIKVQQKRPKTEDRRAFENLSVHFGCAENLSALSEKDGVLQMN